MEIYFWRPRHIIGAGLAKYSRGYRTRFHPRASGLTNFGDELGPWIIARILENAGIGFPKQQFFSSRPAFFSVGSVTHVARNNDIIWGSGALGGIKPALGTGVRKLDIHALRGPLTRDLLISQHGFEPFTVPTGDPAILVPILFPELQKIQGSTGTLLLPHMDDPTDMPQAVRMGFDFAHATDPFLDVVARIAGAEKVITSSLHGKILADAFGVPSVVYQGPTTKPFKFEDYALGTSQKVFEIAASLELASSMQPSNVPDLQDVASKLLASFPMEYFE